MLFSVKRYGVKVKSTVSSNIPATGRGDRGRPRKVFSVPTPTISIRSGHAEAEIFRNAAKYAAMHAGLVVGCSV